MKKQVLHIGQNGTTREYFIMGNKGQLPGTPYYKTMKQATIAMMQMDSKKYTNIYDMSENQYTKWINQ